SIADRTAAPGTALSVQVPVNNQVPGRALVYSLVGSPPPGAAINASSGLITWTPARDQAGQAAIFTVQVAVAGKPNLNSTGVFHVNVLAPPQLGPITLDPLRKGGTNKGTIAIHIAFNETMAASAGAAGQYVLTTTQKARGRKKGTVNVA